MIRLRQGIAALLVAALIISDAGATASAQESEAPPRAEDIRLGVYLNELLPQKLSGKNTDITAEICDYIRQALPYYLSANNLYGDFDFFEPIRIQNWDNDGEIFEKYLIAAAKDGTVSGLVTVTRSENRLISGFRPAAPAELGEALFSNAEIQIGYKNGFLLLFDGEHFTKIEGPDSPDKDVPENPSVNEDLSEPIGTAGTVISAKRTNTKIWEVPDIRTVHNDSGADVLLCWAACAACMGMQNSPGTVYSAKSLYKICLVFHTLTRFSGQKICTSTSRLHSEEPHGCEQWTLFALRLVGITAETSRALTSRRVSGLLGQDKPIMIAARKSKDSRSAGHTAVLYRYEEISDSCGLYTFMDPGMGSSNCAPVTVLIDRSVMENGDRLVLPSTAGTYTNWYRSCYASD